MRSKKIISAVTALVLAASVAAGCAENKAEDATSAAEEKKVTTTEAPALTEPDTDTTTAEKNEEPAVTDAETEIKEVSLDGGDYENMKVVSLESVSRVSSSERVSGSSVKPSDEKETDRKWSDKKPEEKKKLTVMIYMIGSDLESNQAGMAATRDVVEMVNSGLDDKDVNLVVYCGGAKTWWMNGYPTGKNAYLEYKSEGADMVADGKGGINIYSDDKKNMGEADTFKNFLKEVPDKYPADDYALICWDHGAGPVLGYGMDELNTDAKTGMGDTLTLAEMKSALEASQFKSKKLKFVGFDACLMSSIEIADAWQDYAEYLIASADIEPGCGWDYSFLGNVKGTTDTKDICTSVIDSYFEYLKKISTSSYISSATLGAFDLSKTNEVKDAIGGVCKAMNTDLQAGNADTYDKFLDGVHSYASYDLADLGTMATSLSGDYKTETSELTKSVQDMLVDGSTTIKGTCGLSVYFPLTNSVADYNMSNALYALGGSDLIEKTPLNEDYHELMNTLFEPVEGGNSGGSSNKPESSSAAETSSAAEVSSATEVSSAAEVSSAKEENSSKAEASSAKEENSSKAEASSAKEETSSAAKDDTSSEKKDDTSSKADTASSAAETSSAKEDSSSKPDDSSKPDSKPKDKSIYDELDIEVVPKGSKSSNKDYKEDGYAYAKLTDEQIKNMRGVYYTVLMNVGFEGKTEWAPRILYIPAEVDKDGIVKMDLDPINIGVVTDRDSQPVSCLTKYMGKGQYHSAGVLYAEEEISEERMVIALDTAVDDKGEAKIIGLNSDESTDNGLHIASKDEIDLTEWMTFSSPYSGYVPDEKNPRKHYSELEKSVFGADFVFVGEAFDVKAFHLSEMPMEYAVQMSVFTLDGKEYCSNIGNYEFKDASLDKLKEEKTDNGTLKFAVLDDHAELVTYETKDQEKDGKIVIPDKVDGKNVTVVRDEAFKNCAPTEIVFPDTVETLGCIPSSGSSKLTKVTLPKNLKVIPAKCFSYASALESVTIPDSVETIGAFAFNASGLKEITIPKNVTVIDTAAFADCISLDKITVAKENKTFTAEENVLYTADKKKLIAFTGQSKEEFTVPDGVTEIGAYAFSGAYERGILGDEHTGLKKITMPDSLVKIGDFAFRNCTGFTELTLPKNLEYIGTSAFGIGFLGHQENELEVLKIGANVNRIRDYAFTGYKAKKIEVDKGNCFFKTDGKKLTSIDGSQEINIFGE